MKKILSIGLAVLMLVTSISVIFTLPTTAASMPTAQMINNGDFETPTGITLDSIPNRIPMVSAAGFYKWFRATNGNATQYDAIIEDGEVAGNHYAKIAGHVFHGMDLKPARTYELSFKLKSDYALTALQIEFANYTSATNALGAMQTNVISQAVLTSTLPSGVTFGTITAGATANVQTTNCFQIKTVPASTTWSTFTVRITTRGDMPLTPNAMKFTAANFNTGDPMFYYLDDVSMNELDPYALNLFENPNFTNDLNYPKNTSWNTAINTANYEGDTLSSALTARPTVSAMTLANSHYWYRATGGAFSAGTTNAYSGTVYEDESQTNKILKIGQNTAQTINAPLNRTYRLSFKVKVKSTAFNANFQINFTKVNAANTGMDAALTLSNVNAYRSYTYQGNPVTEAIYNTATPNILFVNMQDDAKFVDNWVTYTYTFKLSSGTTYTTELVEAFFTSTAFNINYGNVANRFVYMDDVSMVDVTENSSSYMENSDFSSGLDNWVVAQPTLQTAQVKSDDDGNYLRLQNNSATYGLFNTDKTMRFTAGKTYKLSFKVRRPSETTYVAAQAPIFGFYVPSQDTSLTTTPSYSATYYEGRNDYAYSYASASTLTRRTAFSAQYTVTTAAGATQTVATTGYSTFGKDVVTQFSTLGLNATNVYEDWTTVNYTFTLPADSATYDADVRFTVRLRNANDTLEIRDILMGEAATVAASVDDTGVKGGYIASGKNTASVVGGNITLSAVAYEGFAFEGWYLGSTKVSSNATTSVTVSGNANYVAKFVNLKGNIYTDSSFENYGATGTSLYWSPNAQYSKYEGADKWEFVNSSNDVIPVARPDTWGKITVTDTVKRSGDYSLKLEARYQDAMTTLAVEPNTDYRASVWYYFDPVPANVTTTNPSLDSSTPALTPNTIVERAGVMSADNDRVRTTSLAFNNVIVANNMNDYVNHSQWRQVVVYFNSGDETAVKFFIKQSSNIANSTPAMYIDDLSITKVGADVEHVGTAIRTTGIQGLRFKTKVDKSMIATVSTMLKGSKVVEYGTVAIKADYLGEQELLLDGSYVVGGKERKAVGVAYQQGVKDVRFSETESTIHFTAVLTNISAANYTKEYVIRPYLIMEDSAGVRTTVYGETQSQSIFGIAQLAYSAKNSDGSYKESTETRQYLFDNILHVVDPATYSTFLN